MKAKLLGYMCSDDTLTPFAMRSVREEAWPQDQDRAFETVGFGWLQESRTLLRKHPSQDDEPVNALGLLCDIPARTIIGYMGGDGEGGFDTLDLQPFRFRKWLFAQSGSVPRLEEYRDEILADIPDHIRRNVQGQTDAELVVHRFYQRMSERDALDGGRPDGEEVADALAETLDEFSERSYEAGHEGPLDFNLVAATERLLIVARLGDPLHYRTFDGIDQPGEDPLFAGHSPRRVEHPHFDGAFLASGLEPDDDRWHEIERRQIVWIDHSWKAHSRDL